MTLPPVMRIFFAIDLPAAVKEKLGTYIAQLKKQTKPHAIRWTRAENLHITLQFLTEVKTPDLSALIEHVRAQLLGKLNAITLQWGTLQVFPNPYRPRVLVLDVTPQLELAQLAGYIGEGISHLSYPLEKRAFRAHLTLGRLKYAQGVSLSELLSEKPPAPEPISVSEVVSFRSEPQEHGSKYTILERIELQRSA